MNLKDKLQMFSNRLTKVYRHRSKQSKGMGVSCYRLYDRDLPEFPISVDYYEGRLCVSEYRAKHGMTEEEHNEWLEGTIQVLADVLQIDDANIFTKERRRKTDRLSQYEKTAEEKVFFEVKESGLSFLVNLSDYLDTGLFLDHRLTRQMVKAESEGKDVLNLFAYTGSFSVYAAAGGAASVTTVDLSNTYIDWAKKNFHLNNLNDTKRYHFIVEDVKQYLREAKAASFDLIVMDPPTFSNSKKMKDILDIQRDHAELINEALRILRPGGVLYFSTNARKFELNASAIETNLIKDITRQTTPFDFEGKLLRWCWKMQKEAN
jgi:23S rRNA (cytosine1962-C5)-methyltransferase